MWNAIKRACRWVAGWIAAPFRWIGIKLGLIESDAQRTAREQARAEQARAEQARAEQARAEQARAEQAREQQAREQQVREKSTKECAISQALVEINVLIEHALDTLKNHINYITEEKGLLYLYIAFSNLIAAAAAQEIFILKKDILEHFRPAKFFVITAYDELAKNIFMKTWWRTGVDQQEVLDFLQVMKFNLLERLANKAGEGYLARVSLSLLSEEEKQEFDWAHLNVVEEILKDSVICAPLNAAIEKIEKERAKSSQAQASEDKDDSGTQESSWDSAPPVVLEEPQLISKEQRALEREKRAAMFSILAKKNAESVEPGSSDVVAQEGEGRRSPGPG